MDSLTQQQAAYTAQHAQEQAGTGIATSQALSYPEQQSMQAQQEALAAAQAAAIDKATKARINWTPPLSKPAPSAKKTASRMKESK